MPSDKIEINCFSCQQTNDSDSRFCSNCGAALNPAKEARCKKCCAVLAQPHARLCQECGSFQRGFKSHIGFSATLVAICTALLSTFLALATFMEKQHLELLPWGMNQASLDKDNLMLNMEIINPYKEDVYLKSFKIQANHQWSSYEKCQFEHFDGQTKLDNLFSWSVTIETNSLILASETFKFDKVMSVTKLRTMPKWDEVKIGCLKLITENSDLSAHRSCQVELEMLYIPIFLSGLRFSTEQVKQSNSLKVSNKICDQLISSLL
ncbi:MAG: zinc ribbon domain-containing protein [Algicola sp.]|nr:zinc ribbon domain-containing protein [Algicola sp.]